jgi:hypothetical protein
MWMVAWNGAGGVPDCMTMARFLAGVNHSQTFIRFMAALALITKAKPIVNVNPHRVTLSFS